MSKTPARPSKSPDGQSPRTVAVIDIGTTSIRMAIAEIATDGEVRTLETLVQSVALGREAFENRRLSRRASNVRLRS